MKANLERKSLFDGFGDELAKKKFEIHYNGESYEISPNELIHFDKLEKELSPSVFNDIVESFKIRRKKSIIRTETHYDYFIEDRIGLYYHRYGDVIILASAGEVQPLRERLIFEGLYDLEPEVQFQ